MGKKKNDPFERINVYIHKKYEYEFNGAPFGEIIERVKKWAVENQIDDWQYVYFDTGYSMGYYNNPDIHVELSATRPETDTEYNLRIEAWNKRRLLDLENAKKAKAKQAEIEYKEWERLKKKYGE